MQPAFPFAVRVTEAAYPMFSWAILERVDEGELVICESLESFPTRFSALFEGRRMLDELTKANEQGRS